MQTNGVYSGHNSESYGQRHVGLYYSSFQTVSNQLRMKEGYYEYLDVVQAQGKLIKAWFCVSKCCSTTAKGITAKHRARQRINLN